MEKQSRKATSSDQTGPAERAVPAATAAPTGLTPTPPIPADLTKIDLTDNARQVLIRRYVRRGDDGKPAETRGGDVLACGLSHCRG